MSKTNKQIFEEFVDQVLNKKNFDLINEYMEERCTFHTPPYVGLGFHPDTSSGDKVIVQLISPNSPAAEHLQVGDEVLQIRDENGVRDTYEQLSSGTWGQGKLGAPIELTIRRGDKTFDVSIARGLIEHFDSVLSETFEQWKDYMNNIWPDMDNKINLLIQDGENLAYAMTSKGTNNDYKRSAIWAECGIVRFKDGKITEWWSVEDTLSQYRQLGHFVKEPEKVQG